MLIYLCNQMFDGDGVSSQIYTRDTKLPIPPCVMSLSAMGLNLGGLQVFADRTRKSIHKINAFTIFTHPAAFYACLSLHSYPQYMQVTHALD